MTPTFFKNQDGFRNWLESNYEKETELLVGFYKVSSGKQNMTWSESVDQALCFGWIDGVRRSIDSESYSIRFTPRRGTSIWSAVNIKKIAELKSKGLMFPAGLASYEKRTDNKSAIYAFENDPVDLRKDFEQKFKARPRAWKFFQKQAPSYKRTCYYWIMTAKQEKTKLSRLERLINESESGVKV
ncbi:MAG: YdeI/OmpD-associated family protein [Bacteroidota bacterium]